MSELTIKAIRAAVTPRTRCVFLLLAALPACATLRMKPDAAQSERPRVPQSEIQEDLQRFSGDLLAHLTEAARPLMRTDSVEIRETAMQQLLIYESAALDIATGPTPEVNLLDMLVFVELSRAVFERHWIGLLGEQGRPILVALNDSKQRLARLASKVLPPERQRSLDGLIARWLALNPERIDVAGIRFTAFSELAGQLSSQEREEVEGTFGAVMEATQTADEAVLLAERVRFLATRYPYLVRLHTRLGVSEVASDTLSRLGDVEQSVAKLSEARPFVQDLTALAIQLEAVMNAAQAVLNGLQPVLERFPKKDQVGEAGDKTVPVLERMTDVLAQLDALLSRDPGATAAAMRAAEQGVDRLLGKIVLYLVLVGAAWSALFWGGYAAVRALTRGRHRAHASRPPRSLNLRPRT